MNAYAKPAITSLAPTTATSADISRMFKRKPGWFDHSRVRKRLYAAGFPHPVDTGRWSLVAVVNWIASAGQNPENVPPDFKPMPGKRGPKRNGYAAP